MAGRELDGLPDDPLDGHLDGHLDDPLDGHLDGHLDDHDADPLTNDRSTQATAGRRRPPGSRDRWIGDGDRSRHSAYRFLQLSATGQVFWLEGQPTARAFPGTIAQWQTAGFVTSHSGGTAPDSHGIPCWRSARRRAARSPQRLGASRARSPDCGSRCRDLRH